MSTFNQNLKALCRKQQEQERKSAAPQTQLRQAEEQKRQTQLRQAEEQKRQTQLRQDEEQKRQTQLRQAEEQKRQTQLIQAEEQKRQTQLRQAEEQKRQTQLRQAEEQKRQNQLRQAEEQKRQTQLRQAEEQKRQTQLRQQEEQDRKEKQEEQERVEELRRGERQHVDGREFLDGQQFRNIQSNSIGTVISVVNDRNNQYIRSFIPRFILYRVTYDDKTEVETAQIHMEPIDEKDKKNNHIFNEKDRIYYLNTQEKGTITKKLIDGNFIILQDNGVIVENVTALNLIHIYPTDSWYDIRTRATHKLMLYDRHTRPPIEEKKDIRQRAVEIYQEQLDELKREKPPMTQEIRGCINSLSRNRDIFTSEELEYIPRISETQQLDEFKETLVFATFNINKMSYLNKVDFMKFAENRMYEKLRAPCVWISPYIVRRDVTFMDKFSICFLIYRKNTYEIISSSFVKEDETQNTPNVRKLEIKFFCSFIDEQRDRQTNPLDKLYPYKGLGNQLMDRLQAKLKVITQSEMGQAARTELRLISSHRGENFYIKKGFALGHNSSYYTKTYQKYLKYKEKYLKLKNLMSKN